MLLKKQMNIMGSIAIVWIIALIVFIIAGVAIIYIWKKEPSQ